VRARVELAVLNQKKNQFLVQKAQTALQGRNSLDAVASELGVNVREANNINFTSVQVPGIGMEPKVVGAATHMAANQLSQPIAGNNGVYIIEVYDVEEGPANGLESEKMRLAQNLNFRAASQAYNVHREKADIDDQRARFY
jgi:peptidyl-prolyl cis-trans isomerase D